MRKFAAKKKTMGKGKLAKFADMEAFENVFQCPFETVAEAPFVMRGHWHDQYFKNDHPIVLELGCGRGEYTVGLARLYPDVNFIGIDIKGARMWTGAKQAIEEGLGNVAFLRTHIELLDRFFAPGEVQEIWLTFSDPQMKHARKRLTGTRFLNLYRQFLTDGGVVHLKTDSLFLYTYTSHVVDVNRLPLIVRTDDLYHTEGVGDKKILSIQTYYESMWIERGLNIKYLKFRLPQAGELVEPEVDIPLDEYRSYHRTKSSPKEVGR